ncbi:MAG: GNAT family N-acetyltransferase [Prochlorococcus sp.]|jgi:hypothetical protein
MANLITRWHHSLKEIPEHHWRSLVGEQAMPFYRWQWLAALEDSASISIEQGWQPLHLALWRGDAPVAVAPLYLKVHSAGEFVFDQIFARLAGALDLSYYPKLLGMSPVSPVQGYRFYVASGENEAELTAMMLQSIDSFAYRNNILSCNFLYVDPQWRALAEAAGCATWLNQQSLLSTNGLQNFSDYLNRFDANQRRNIKRERKAVIQAGLKVSALTGSDLDVQLLQRMHNFYEQHCARWGDWGSKYLSKSFFEALAKSPLKDQVVLFSAHRDDPRDPVAMSLCIQDEKTLWGRYWGSKEEINCLHFEVCYYSPIAWALEKGIQNFDPGAGGSHKRRRGFLAKPHASLHRWYDNRMDSLIREWLPQANKLMIEEIKAANAESPFQINSPHL